MIGCLARVMTNRDYRHSLDGPHVERPNHDGPAYGDGYILEFARSLQCRRLLAMRTLPENGDSYVQVSQVELPLVDLNASYERLDSVFGLVV